MSSDVITKKSHFSICLEKIVQRGDAKWEKEELLDVLYWWRQIFGLLCGVIWGIVPLLGLISFFLYIVVAIGATVMFYRSFLSIDEDDFGGFSELIQEGFPTSTALFILTWVCIFSSFYF